MQQQALSGSQSNLRFIKYRHDLAQKYHCPVLSLMIQQFEHWFKKQHDKKAKLPNSSKIEANVFYKFISPPQKHHLYRQGDSWTEELCITADVFRLHFKKIGVAYKSYRLFKEAQEKGDVFQGKRYASYYNRLKRQVFFIKNLAYDDSLDLGIHVKDKRDFAVISQPKRKLKKKSNQVRQQLQPQDQGQIQQSIIASPGISSICQSLETLLPINTDNANNDMGTINHVTVCPASSTLESPSFTNQEDLGQSMSLTDVNITQDTLAKSVIQKMIKPVSRKLHLTRSNAHVVNKCFHRKHSISFSIKEKESVISFISPQDIGNKMIAIWQNRVGDTKLDYISVSLLTHLQDILKDYFEDSLLNWDAYCQKIASSKFLMGEGKAWTFKGSIYLIWAIKAENIIKLQENRIRTGDRERSLSANEQALKQQCVNIIKEINNIKRQQETVSIEVNRSRRWVVQDQVKDVLQGKDTRQLEHYQQQFEQMIQSGNKDDATWSYADCAQNFNVQQWRTMNRSIGRTENPWWYFERYLIDTLATQHFGQDESQMLIQHHQQLDNQLQQLSQQLKQLNQNRELN